MYGAKSVYRHDNAPHAVWQQVATFPQHFHDGREDTVVASYISSEPQQAIREFCRFIRTLLRGENPSRGSAAQPAAG